MEITNLINFVMLWLALIRDFTLQEVNTIKCDEETSLRSGCKYIFLKNNKIMGEKKMQEFCP